MLVRDKAENANKGRARFRWHGGAGCWRDTAASAASLGLHLPLLNPID